jgi:hypothetical protein
MKKMIRSALTPFVLVCVASVSRSQITDDALTITLRSQEGIRLDSTLAQRIDSGLVAAREEVDTLAHIHVFPDYVYTDLFVQTSAQWNIAWRQGEILTGEHYIDSLGHVYGLIAVRTISLTLYLLTFSAPLQMYRLSDLYALHPDVTSAGANGYGGDGDDIEYVGKNGTLLFGFSDGWGDCPAGCIHRYYWYVSVVPNQSGFMATLEEERYRDITQPIIYRWNMPPRYPMTLYANADSILYSITRDPRWWVRRHAIEGTWRFFVNSSPWVNEDLNSHWYTLKNDLQSRLSEVIDTLEVALLDLDPEVRVSAEFAITQIVPVSVSEEGIEQAVFVLYQSYPNPFNPITTILYALFEEAFITLKVFNTLGQEVATLVNEKKEAGSYQVRFDGTHLSSGVYFYRLKAGEYVETKKLVLLR